MAIEQLREFFDFPWAGVAGFAAVLALILIKVPIAARWFGSGVQEMLGVTALRDDMKAMHQDNKKAISELTTEVKQNVTRIDARIDEHESTKEAHQ